MQLFYLEIEQKLKKFRRRGENNGIMPNLRSLQCVFVKYITW